MKRQTEIQPPPVASVMVRVTLKFAGTDGETTVELRKGTKLLQVLQQILPYRQNIDQLVVKFEDAGGNTRHILAADFVAKFDPKGAIKAIAHAKFRTLKYEPRIATENGLLLNVMPLSTINNFQ